MLQATGPGTISFSHDAAGEILALPIQPGSAIDVREHHLVAATLGVGYDWYETGIWFTTSGDSGGSQEGGRRTAEDGVTMAGMDVSGRDERRNDETRWVYPAGRYIDRFTAGPHPGLVLVQCGGNAFIRDLADGESILVKPPALLYKDPTVGMRIARRVPGRRNEAVARLGEPLSMAEDHRPGADRPPIKLRPSGGPGDRLPGQLPVHPASLEVARRDGQRRSRHQVISLRYHTERGGG